MHRITAMLRVKNESAQLRRCLDSLRPFVQHAVVLDDGSSDDTLSVARAHPLVTHAVHSPKGYFHEGQDRIVTLALAQLTEPEWVLMADADEEWESGFATVLPDILSSTDAKALAFHYCNLVNSDTDYDLYPFRFALFRFDPRRVHYWPARSHLNVPHVDDVPGQWVQTNLRILHTGYRNKDAKVALAAGRGYVFGDYLTPRYRLSSGPTGLAPAWRVVERPSVFPGNMDDVAKESWVPKPGERRFPDFASDDDRRIFLFDYAMRNMMWHEAGQELASLPPPLEETPEWQFRRAAWLCVHEDLSPAREFISGLKTVELRTLAPPLLAASPVGRNGDSSLFLQRLQQMPCAVDIALKRLEETVRRRLPNRVAVFGAGAFWPRVREAIGACAAACMLCDDRNNRRDPLSGMDICAPERLPGFSPDLVILATDTHMAAMRSRLDAIFAGRTKPPILAFPFIRREDE